MKKIMLEVAPPKNRTNDSVVRVSTDIYHQIARISALTRQPMTMIVNTLLTEALSAVELVETPLYDMTIKTED